MLSTRTHVTPRSRIASTMLPQPHVHKSGGVGKTAGIVAFFFLFMQQQSVPVGGMTPPPHARTHCSLLHAHTHTHRSTCAKECGSQVVLAATGGCRREETPWARSRGMSCLGAKQLAQLLRSRRSLRKPSGVRMWSEPMTTSQFLTSLVTSYAQRISE